MVYAERSWRKRILLRVVNLNVVFPSIVIAYISLSMIQKDG